jgi:hypothetical protein
MARLDVEPAWRTTRLARPLRAERQTAGGHNRHQAYTATSGLAPDGWTTPTQHLESARESV